MVVNAIKASLYIEKGNEEINPYFIPKMAGSIVE